MKKVKAVFLIETVPEADNKDKAVVVPAVVTDRQRDGVFLTSQTPPGGTSLIMGQASATSW